MNIDKYLKTSGLHVESYDSVDSTNTILRTRAEDGAPEGTVIIAGSQTAGRGRMGRSFYSPDGTGLYMSLLLRPELPTQESLLITTCAAVAVAESIEHEMDKPAQIKWVNDVFVDGGKVCGILTEAVADPDTGRLRYAVLGIGVNITAPEEGFPEELRGVASALLPFGDSGELRERLAAGILDSFMGYYKNLTDKSFLEAYRSRSMIDGREVWLISRDGSRRSARVLGIDDNFQLMVDSGNNGVEKVIFDEISIKY